MRSDRRAVGKPDTEEETVSNMNIPGYDAWRLQGPDDDQCPECDGHKRHDCMNCGGDGEVADGVECPICEGTGEVECETCSGDEPDGDYEYERRRDREYE